MKDIITYCGYRCNLCLAYKDNVKSEKDKQKFSDGLFKYFGFRMDPEECYCEGCRKDETKDPKPLDTNCPVRPCAIEKEMENCANCENYICNKLRKRIVEYEKVAARYGKPIPEEDYNNFIKPYENKKVLDEIRIKIK